MLESVFSQLNIWRSGGVPLLMRKRVSIGRRLSKAARLLGSQRGQRCCYQESSVIKKVAGKEVVRHFFTTKHDLFSVVEVVYDGLVEPPFEANLISKGVLKDGEYWRAPKLYFCFSDEKTYFSCFYEDLDSLDSVRPLRFNGNELEKVAFALGRMSRDVSQRMLDDDTQPSMPKRLGINKRGLMRASFDDVDKRILDGEKRLNFLSLMKELSTSLSDKRHKIREIPFVVAHCDANRGNVFWDDRVDGIVLIDWEHARVAPLGTEMCQLMYSSLWGIKTGVLRNAKTLSCHEGKVVDAYATGLYGAEQDMCDMIRVGMDIKLATMYLYRALPKVSAKLDSFVEREGDEAIGKIRENVDFLLSRAHRLNESLRNL